MLFIMMITSCAAQPSHGMKTHILHTLELLSSIWMCPHWLPGTGGIDDPHRKLHANVSIPTCLALSAWVRVNLTMSLLFTVSD